MITNCDDAANRQISMTIPDDNINSNARFINISLAHGQGLVTNCLKVTLTYDTRSKWILISEVLFDSVPITSNIPLLTTTHNYSPPLIGN